MGVASTAGMGIAVDECDPLNVIADVMIVLVPAHYQVLLRLLQTQVSHWLRTLARNVYICQVLARLTAMVLRLISEAGK